MKAFIPSYNLIQPTSLQDALEIISEKKQKWRLFSGGTDLMVQLESGKLLDTNFISLWGLNELKGVSKDNDFLTLGALTTYADLRNSREIATFFPMLIDAAKVVGSLAIQNRATIGGNIANASPAADGPPAFLCYDAEIEATSLNGSRWIKYKDFHLDYKKIELKNDEIITRVRMPLSASKGHHYYHKVGTRAAQSISKVCFALRAEVNDKTISDIRIAIGSVAATPLRAIKTESILRQSTINSSVISKAIDSLDKEITPIDDIRSLGSYRKKVTINLLENFLRRF